MCEREKGEIKKKREKNKYEENLIKAGCREQKIAVALSEWGRQI